MSKISFLDNVNNGKNTRGSYLLTILITVIGGTIASIVFLVLFMLLYFSSLKNVEMVGAINILNNPLLILIFIGVTYGIFALLFYLCIRFIHKKNFIKLINTGNSIKWTTNIKGCRIMGGNTRNFYCDLLYF